MHKLSLKRLVSLLTQIIFKIALIPTVIGFMSVAPAPLVVAPVCNQTPALTHAITVIQTGTFQLQGFVDRIACATITKKPPKVLTQAVLMVKDYA